MVFAYWLRTITANESVALDNLLKVVHRHYDHPLEEKVPLVVKGHRGRIMDDHHPKNVLDGDPNTIYYSEKVQFSSHREKDWINFRQKEQRSFVPTKIMIRNVGHQPAIKSISIQWSEEGGLAYQDLISYVVEQGNHEQFLSLNAEQYSSMKYIKLIILDNYGNPHNQFKEFVVFGVYP